MIKAVSNVASDMFMSVFLISDELLDTLFEGDEEEIEEILISHFPIPLLTAHDQFNMLKRIVENKVSLMAGQEIGKGYFDYTGIG